MPTGHVSPWYIEEFPNLYIRHPITEPPEKQPMEGHVSYPIDTKPGLCSSQATVSTYQAIVNSWRVSNELQSLFILRSSQYGRHFTDDTFEYIFGAEKIWMSMIISLNVVSKNPFRNQSTLVQIMACHRPGDILFITCTNDGWSLRHRMTSLGQNELFQCTEIRILQA